MATGTRDRTARSRIREYLAVNGPIEDDAGRATSILKDAIGYQGSAVAFIQLVTAMDKANEVVRHIKGKRTYRISAPVSATASPRWFPASGASPGAPESSRLIVNPSMAIDYDELARALLREVWRVIGSPDRVGSESVQIENIRREKAQLVAERDESVKRLQVARQQILALIGSAITGEGVPTDLEAASQAGGDYQDRDTGDLTRELLAKLFVTPEDAAEHVS